MSRSKRHHINRLLADDMPREYQVYRHAYEYQGEWKGVFFY